MLIFFDDFKSIENNQKKLFNFLKSCSFIFSRSQIFSVSKSSILFFFLSYLIMQLSMLREGLLINDLFSFEEIFLS